MSKKRIYQLLLGSLILGSLLLIHGISASLGQEKTSPGQKVKFGSATKQSPNYEFFYLAAEHEGLWKRQGLEVEWIPFTAGSMMYQTVAAGHISMGMSDVPSFLQAVVGGVQISAVADLKSPQLYALVVLPDSPIKDARGLKGTKIAITRIGSSTHIFGRFLAKKLGLEKDIRFVGIGGFAPRMAALKSGEVQGMITGFASVANYLARDQIRRVVKIDDYLPKGWVNMIAFGRRDYLESKPQLAMKVVRGLLEAAEFVMSNQGWAKEQLKGPFGYSEEAAGLVLRELIFTGAGPLNRAGLEQSINFFIEYGLFPREKVPPIELIYTNIFAS